MSEAAVLLAVVNTEGAAAAGRLARVPGWFAVWERRLSRFRQDSALAIAQALVEAMGGRMEAMSELGRGTTIWLTLPTA